MLQFFAHPWFLLLLLIAPLHTWWWLRRPHKAVPFPTFDSLRGAPGHRAAAARWGGAGLRFLGLCTLIAALAGPRWPDHGTRVTVEGIAIAIVVDISGSMSEKDFTWGPDRITRIDAVKRACNNFVNGSDEAREVSLPGRKSDLICLVTFATRPESPCPLTLSHSVLLRTLDEAEPRRVPTESETNIGDAIAWSLYKLESAGNCRKMILLLTDGEHNVPPPALKPRQAAQLAASLRVPVYVIDVGGKPSSLEKPLPKPLDSAPMAEETLQAVVRATGGRYFRADDSAMLLSACQDIDRMERHEIESFQYRRFYEGYAWFGFASLVFFLSVYLLDNSRWLRSP